MKFLYLFAKKRKKFKSAFAPKNGKVVCAIFTKKSSQIFRLYEILINKIGNNFIKGLKKENVYAIIYVNK